MGKRKRLRAMVGFAIVVLAISGTESLALEQVFEFCQEDVVTDSQQAYRAEIGTTNLEAARVVSVVFETTLILEDAAACEDVHIDLKLYGSGGALIVEGEDWITPNGENLRVRLPLSIDPATNCFSGEEELSLTLELEIPLRCDDASLAVSSGSSCDVLRVFYIR